MLLALYVGCLALGGVLIAASLVGGGGDGDADHGDVDHGDVADGDLDHGDLDHGDLDHGDVDHGGADHHDLHPGDASATHGGAPHAGLDHGVSAAVAATLLSFRFWTFALAAFGLTGVLLTLLGAAPWLSVTVSVLNGVASGAIVSTMLRRISRDTVTSAIDTRTLSGADAVVILSVGPHKLGKVRLTHRGQILELPATTREGRLLDRGERVLVVSVLGGTADITPGGPPEPFHPPNLTTS